MCGAAVAFLLYVYTYTNGSPPHSSRTLIRTITIAWTIFTGSVLLSSEMVYNIFYWSVFYHLFLFPSRAFLHFSMHFDK